MVSPTNPNQRTVRSILISILVVGTGFLPGCAGGQWESRWSNLEENAPAPVGYGTLRSPAARPLSFVRNIGQAPADLRFLSAGTGYSVGFADDRVVLSFRDLDRDPASAALADR